jgi:hypothetical protein|tara:strand:- start:2002 stop:2157 length:156 start_codon:yes stop_codon:yes gene_type:complete
LSTSWAKSYKDIKRVLDKFHQTKVITTNVTTTNDENKKSEKALSINLDYEY